MSEAPHAAASTGGMPNPSYFDGYTKAADAEYSVGKSASLTP
eukprot:CAMPEP_0173102518 /NCGR_PEP_ID=MMETSP1102-20130122/37635_1 /TAXON_ID=49646 /ORGANISM="Geminigera sp., Strain Caron Lab Isolate" /LENGTH=41 /DNA_ID= /DNA_START= /DNA_END= /DNA_ORIENTATION=